MSGKFLDLETWPRRSHYEFYRNYENPFFSVVTDVPVTSLYAQSKRPGGPSFFLATLFLALRAANRLEAFRLRLRGDRVWLHDRVHAGSTIMRDDETFAFAHFDAADSFPEFARAGAAEIARVKSAPAGLVTDNPDDEIYFSVLPWIRFTSTSSAHASGEDCVPRIVFGKLFERDGEKRMPVSVEAHHSLMDGLHIGKFLEMFEAELRDF